MKKIFATIALAVIAIVALAGCRNYSTSNALETRRQDEAQAEMNRQVPQPRITNWREKKEVGHVYELRDKQDLIMYIYAEDMNGHLHFRGKSLGFPIPYATQFNAPHRAHIDNTTDYHAGEDQAEPNGLFPPAAAEGTTFERINRDGSTSIAYAEPRVYAFTEQLTPEEMQ